MNSGKEDETPTVLIVDDNPTNVKVIALTLRQLQFKLVIATNGNSAIEMVEKTRPDLVLLDVMMPGIDGYQTCKIIKSKSENQDLPIVFLTALSDKENTVKGFQSGGVDYITKPFDKNELISRVKTHIQLKRTQDKLKETSQHLSNLNSLKDKMFSVIGHDLRSPLGSMKMTLEFLSATLDDAAESELKSTLNTLTSTTGEVFSLLENLLSWARSQSGNISLIEEEIDLNELVTSIYLLNKGALKQKEIEFTAEVGTDTKVVADLTTLKTVFRNLLSNAIKFTPVQGKISIVAQEIADKVKVDIKDTGVGIPEENIPKLFDETQHLTTYGTNREVGSGLGLILCKDFIERNGGSIQVESEEGKGTTFSLFLKK